MYNWCMKITSQKAAFGAPWIPRWVLLDGKIIGSFTVNHCNDNYPYGMYMFVFDGENSTFITAWILSDLFEKIKFHKT